MNMEKKIGPLILLFALLSTGGLTLAAEGNPAPPVTGGKAGGATSLSSSSSIAPRVWLNGAPGSARAPRAPERAPRSIPLAAVTLTETQIGLGVLGLFATLIGYHFTIGRYIREQAGVKEVGKTEVVNSPLVTSAKVEFLPMQEFKEFETYVHKREHDLRENLQHLQTAIDERRDEAVRDLTAIREKIEEAFNESVKSSNSSASKTHARIDALAQQQGVMTGELKQVSATLQGINSILQKKALGGGK